MSEANNKKEDRKKSVLMKLKALLTKKNPNRKKMEVYGAKENILEPRK
jgi:hypothetical protein